MTESGNIHLRLDAAGIDSYCRGLARHLATPEKRIAALDALKTFLAAQVSSGERQKPAFSQIELILAHHFDEARAELQQRQAASLVTALRDRALGEITPIYTALSRDAFWQLLEMAERELEIAQRPALAEWSRDWLAQAETRSAEASPYPDSIDFKAAGIAVADYTAMRDICHFFSR